MKRLFACLFVLACGSTTTSHDDAGIDASAADAPKSDAAASSNVAASASSACNSNGLYIATSGSTIACGSPISTQLVKPYLQLRLPSTASATYDVTSDCGQGGNVVEAVYDDAQGTHDAVSGSVTLTNVGATVSGSYDLDFGTTKLQASFDASYCP